MTGQSRFQTVDEDGGEGQSYLVSVSDLMSSLVFIFIITLMIFALRYQAASTKVESAKDSRTRLLQILENALKEKGIKVQIDLDQGVLRLAENAVGFPVGQADPVPEHVARIQVLAQALREVVPCFVERANGDDPELTRAQCSRLGIDSVRHSSRIDVLLVEGHTDSRNLKGNGRFRDNLELSSARAAVVWRLLRQFEPTLDSLYNQSDRRVLSVSGYADQRLAVPADPWNDANRRIDLRFVMQPPARESAENAEPAPVPPTRDRVDQLGS